MHKIILLMCSMVLTISSIEGVINTKSDKGLSSNDTTASATSNEPNINRREAPLNEYDVPPPSGLSDSYGAPLPSDSYGPPTPHVGPKPVYGPPPKPVYGPPDLGPPPPSKGGSTYLPPLPKPQYGPPNPFPPSNYGPPPRPQYGPPKPQYGPPKPQYGPPPRPQYAPPKSQYGPPPKPQYGPPPKPQYGLPPKQQYGPPKPQYGPPKPQYGPPKPQYGPPKPQYSLPPKPKPVYGPPPSQPKPVYGPPPSQPKPQYGPPPKPVYGPPKVKPIYGPPPSTSYGVPHAPPGVPSPPTPPQITYDGWQPIPGVSQPPGDTYGAPQGHSENHGDFGGNIGHNGGAFAFSSGGGDFSSGGLSQNYGPPQSQQPVDTYGPPLQSNHGPDLTPPSGGGFGDIHGFAGSGGGDLNFGHVAGFDLTSILASDFQSHGPPKINFGGHPSSNYGPPSNTYGPLNVDISPPHPSSNYGPPSGGYGPPEESGNFGVPLAGCCGTPPPEINHQSGLGLAYGVPSGKQIEGPNLHPKDPVEFREPVPKGLIEALGQSAEYKNSGQGRPFHGGTYIPPSVPEVPQHSNEYNQHQVNHQLTGPEQGNHQFTQGQVHHQFTGQDHLGYTPSQDLSAPPEFTNFGSHSEPLPSVSQPTQEVHEEVLQSLQLQGADISKSKALELTNSVNFPVQGQHGSYTLQIQGQTPNGVSHEQVLSNGLLQDILSAIEKQPASVQNIQSSYGASEPVPSASEKRSTSAEPTAEDEMLSAQESVNRSERKVVPVDSIALYYRTEANQTTTQNKADGSYVVFDSPSNKYSYDVSTENVARHR